MYTAIEDQDIFTTLIQNDVLYQLTTAYPEEGAIEAKDVLALEVANSQPDKEVKQNQIKTVFEEIHNRSAKLRAKALQSRDIQRSQPHTSSDAPKLNVLY